MMLHCASFALFHFLSENWNSLIIHCIPPKKLIKLQYSRLADCSENFVRLIMTLQRRSQPWAIFLRIKQECHILISGKFDNHRLIH